MKISNIRLLPRCALGEQSVFHACIQARTPLRDEVEKFDVLLRKLSETREVVVTLLNAMGIKETLLLQRLRTFEC